MTLQAHDTRCNELQRRLDALRAQGAGGVFRQTQPDGRGGYVGVTAEYTEVLYLLRDACRERLQSCGLGSAAL